MEGVVMPCLRYYYGRRVFFSPKTTNIVLFLLLTKGEFPSTKIPSSRAHVMWRAIRRGLLPMFLLLSDQVYQSAYTVNGRETLSIYPSFPRRSIHFELVREMSCPIPAAKSCVLPTEATGGIPYFGFYYPIVWTCWVQSCVSFGLCLPLLRRRLPSQHPEGHSRSSYKSRGQLVVSRNWHAMSTDE